MSQNKPHILIVGGAGYIGSHTNLYLNELGYQTTVLDNLVYGHQEFVLFGRFVQGDMGDPKVLDDLFQNNDFTAVMHFSAYAYVGESVTDPAKYYHNNLSKSITLLNKMAEYKVKNFIFSSTCATFGKPNTDKVSEDHRQKPINPYGRTKLLLEMLQGDYENAYGMKFINLRYFNAAGADPQCRIGEDHNPETHLIPLILQVALGKREFISIFGSDYKTPDGTCIRDYIHILDLAQAHELALKSLLESGTSKNYNLGNGTSFSVLEVVEIARKVTGHPIPVRMEERRAGDPDMLVGDSQLALKDLLWKPQFADLETILTHAWNWHKKRHG